VQILITNDDGIKAQGLWKLADQLKNIASVTISAPEEGQRAMSMSVSDFDDNRPIRVRKAQPELPAVKLFSIEGTPADSVILGVFKFVEDKIDLIISGINHGSNLGDDVFGSGTVGAALAGFIFGFPSISISVEGRNDIHFDAAAKLATLFAQKVREGELAGNIFLNVNLPNLPLAEIRGIKKTVLAKGVYSDSVEKVWEDKGDFYRMVRYRGNKATDERSDLWAVQEGYISISPLHKFLCPMYNKPSPQIADFLYSTLFQQLQESR
jgi:5'-nucleotidase